MTVEAILSELNITKQKWSKVSNCTEYTFVEGHLRVGIMESTDNVEVKTIRIDSRGMIYITFTGPVILLLRTYVESLSRVLGVSYRVFGAVSRVSNYPNVYVHTNSLVVTDDRDVTVSALVHHDKVYSYGAKDISKLLEDCI